MKARYRVSSKNKATGQLVHKDVYEREMELKAQQLRKEGYDIPVRLPDSEEAVIPSASAPQSHDRSTWKDHYVIAKDQKNPFYLFDLNDTLRDDPAFEVSAQSSYITCAINLSTGLHAYAPSSYTWSAQRVGRCGRGQRVYR